LQRIQPDLHTRLQNRGVEPAGSGAESLGQIVIHFEGAIRLGKVDMHDASLAGGPQSQQRDGLAGCRVRCLPDASAPGLISSTPPRRTAIGMCQCLNTPLLAPASRVMAAMRSSLGEKSSPCREAISSAWLG
jgi:hypothetical protein